MSWQKIEDMPCVMDIIQTAEKDIAEKTGVVVKLHTYFGNQDRVKEMVKDNVCTYLKVSWEDVRSQSRKTKVLNARQAYMFIMIEYFGYTYKEIGRDCDRDHSTAMSAVGKVQGYFDVGDELVDDIKEIMLRLPLKDIKNEV